ncbi:hypothetical protein DAI22_03g081300 [Oryza sativa Japonica Group]|nr:hypothetical protein DAI22_03g081300 [Oryza sativa Japonica Group]
MPPPAWGWGSNPLEPVVHTVAAFSRRLLIAPDAAPDEARLRPLLSLSLSPPPTPPSPPPPPPEVLKKDSKAAPLTKEEVGRATWMLLHTIAAQVLDLLPLFLTNQPGNKDAMRESWMQALF